MVVSVDEARHVARLARLALTDEELATLAVELSVVLEHFESLVEPGGDDGVVVSAADELRADRTGKLRADRTGKLRADRTGKLRADRTGKLRADRTGAMLTPDEALRDAPSSEEDQFSVPGFLPEDS